MALASSVLLCLVWLMVPSLGQPASGAADPGLAKLKSNLLGYWTGAGADHDDPMVADSLRDIERSARAALTSLRPDGSWSDVEYTASPDQEARIAGHLGRIRRMARGFRTPGQAMYGNPDLIGAIERAFAFVRPLAGEDCPTPGNWWWWQVDMPGTLGETLLLMEGRLSPATVGQVEGAIRHLLMEDALDTPPGAGPNRRYHLTLLPPAPGSDASRATGENAIWLAMNHLYLALLTGDAKRAEIVKTTFVQQCAVQKGEGIKEDYSFHQHGPLLYTGGYGADFTDDVAQYIWITRGTPYEIPRANFETFAHYIMDSTLWCIYDNYYDPSCAGRGITRGNSSPMEVPLSLLVLANAPSPWQKEAIAATKCMQQVNPSYAIRTAPLWTTTRKSPTPAAPLVGHRHFWESDYTVHRRPQYFASLRMFSDRTKAAELINREGKTSWHQSDGLLWVFLKGNDYVTHDVLPTLDWLRLPGTTVERKHLEPGEGYSGRPTGAGRSFVGGASTRDHGTSAMELAANACVLTARKSWFFFDDEIVCLGSDINCPSESPAETIVDQRPLSEAAAPLTVDGQVEPATLPWSAEVQNAKWAHCDGIGYYFPEPQRLKLKREMQTGAWRDLNDYSDETPHSNPVLTLWFDHGTHAADAAYAYAVLPRKTAAETQAYAAAEEITILEHDSRTHAVRQDRRNLTGVIFWEPGTAGKLSADRACLAFYEDTGDGLTLAVSDPTHAASTFHVTVDEPLTPTELPAGVSSQIVGDKTVVTYHAENGRNYLARFARPR
jgi:hypothetical protein